MMNVCRRAHAQPAHLGRYDPSADERRALWDEIRAEHRTRREDWISLGENPDHHSSGVPLSTVYLYAVLARQLQGPRPPLRAAVDLSFSTIIPQRRPRPERIAAKRAARHPGRTSQEASMQTPAIRLRPTCPDCGTGVDQPHASGCDVARCLSCFRQRLSCDCNAVGQDAWTGYWPGELEAALLGWWVTGPPYALPDLNRWNVHVQVAPRANVEAIREEALRRARSGQ